MDQTSIPAWHELPVIVTPADEGMERMGRVLMGGRQGMVAPLAAWLVPGGGVQPVPSGLSCSGCVACCVALDVPEVEKPPKTACRHLCAAGCGIQAAKPKRCQDYACAWRLGAVLDSAYRPDKSMMLATVRGWQEFGLRYLDIEMANAMPDPDRMAALIAAFLARGFCVVVTYGGKSTMMGERHDVARIRWLWKKMKVDHG